MSKRHTFSEIDLRNLGISNYCNIVDCTTFILRHSHVCNDLRVTASPILITRIIFKYLQQKLMIKKLRHNYIQLN